MNMKAINTFFGTVLISSALVLTGCGGGGGGGSSSAGVTYTGTTSAAVIDSTNADKISVASGVAVQKAANSLSAPVFVTSSAGSSQVSADNMKQLLTGIMYNYVSAAVPASYTMQGTCGGTLNYSSNPPQTGPWNTSATFSNYCTTSNYTSGNVILNGSVTLSVTDVSTFSDFTASFTNFSVQANGQTTTINSMTLACTSTSGCSYTSEYTDTSGSVYKTGNVSVYGDATTGYSGSLTFYDPTYGYVTVNANAVTYGSCGDYPDGGTIDITDSSSNSISITFTSSPCAYSGTYSLAGGASSSFSGTTP